MPPGELTVLFSRASDQRGVSRVHRSMGLASPFLLKRPPNSTGLSARRRLPSASKRRGSRLRRRLRPLPDRKPFTWERVDYSPRPWWNPLASPRALWSCQARYTYDPRGRFLCRQDHLPRCPRPEEAYRCRFSQHPCRRRATRQWIRSWNCLR